jgi:hypothetical protein
VKRPGTPFLLAWMFLSAAFLLLTRLASAEPQPLDVLLDRTAKEVSLYLDKVSDVRCTERVQQIKLDRSGHQERAEEGIYDYFVLLQGGEDDLLLNESRIPKREPKDRKNTPMLVSNGFSMLFLIFHPYYRNSFQFETESDQQVDGKTYRRLRFTHIAGNRTPAAISVRGREYPLDLSGEAWFDASTGMITHIEAHLNNDMHDVGLKSLRAEIDYGPVALPDWTQSYRFPTLATIEVETLRQHWKNVHHFSEYKRFMVDTQASVSDKAAKNNE